MTVGFDEMLAALVSQLQAALTTARAIQDASRAAMPDEDEVVPPVVMGQSED